MDHNAELDYVGFGHRPRLTCYDCDGETLIKQPYKSNKKWQDEVKEFAAMHPSDVTRRYNDAVSTSVM